MSAYEYAEPDEWVCPIRRGYRLACCDCGLVHDVDFRLAGTKQRRLIEVRMRRNNRATAAMRRWMKAD